jgi:hypothetical protein
MARRAAEAAIEQPLEHFGPALPIKSLPGFMADFCDDAGVCDRSGAQLGVSWRAWGGLLVRWANLRGWPATDKSRYRAGLVQPLRSSPGVLLDPLREGPAEVAEEDFEQIIASGAKGRRLPAPGVGGHLQLPQVGSHTA